MKKMVHTISIILMALLFSCQNEKYSILPIGVDQETLLKAIECDPLIEYWEANYIDGKAKTIFSKGNRHLKNILKYDYGTDIEGFFPGCQPSWCRYNIIYLKNGKQFNVRDTKSLKDFIGKVDNEQEAFLIALINDYEVDWGNWRGKSFLKTENGYNLKVAQIEYCPIKRESFLVEVRQDGILLEIRSLGVYEESEECIVF